MHAPFSLLVAGALAAGLPAQPPGVNVAPLAIPSASFAAGNAVLHAVNDELLPTSDSPLESWHTWASRSDTVAIAYQWSSPMRLDGVEVVWWYDQSDPARGGVQLPTRARVQFWTGSAWTDVTGMRNADGTPASGVGVRGSGVTGANTLGNTVAFDPVSTTRLRLLLTQNRSQVASTGVGISEWRVFSSDPASVVFAKIGFADPQWTTRDLALPREVDGYSIRWTSSDPRVIDAAGRVRRGSEVATATLTAVASRPGGPTLSREFPFTVLPTGSAGRTLELDVGRLGIEISPTLYGLFFEDICHALDGGLNANLIDNGSFQQFNWPTALPEGIPHRGPNDDRYSLDPAEIYSWSMVSRGGAAGSATIVDTHPMNASNGYSVAIQVTGIGGGNGGFGIAANGYAEQPTNVTEPSIAVEAGVGYDLSLFLQGAGYPGRVRVFLENAAGELNSNVVELNGLGDSWREFTGRLTALRTEDSRMVVMGDAEGTFYLDYVSLRPEPSRLWRGGVAGGLRPDMAQAMADHSPGFLRFPGGCASEGKSQDRLFRWKDTVGPREARRQMPNYWGYWSSNEIGFFEYFVLAEQLGAEPLPVIGLGMTCPFHRGPNYYEAPIGSSECPECEQWYRATYVQDALDLIEFANGDTTTRWGKLRAEMGHPEPFDLKYISLGNENWGEAFWERFERMYRAVKEAHPEIRIVSTSGPYAAGRQFDENYRHIDEKYEDTIVDEHYYMASSWFLANRQRYDPGAVRGAEGRTYDRSRATRVFVGEYSDLNSANHFMSALYEAAFTTALERNSDMVVMASYAPLFCKKGMTNWNANLIWFDNRGIWRTPNYWYQWIFSNHVGDRAVPDRFFTFADSAAAPDVYTSASLDSATGDFHLKIVNVDPQPKEFRVVVRNAEGEVRSGEYVYIRSDRLMARNQDSPDHSEAIRPVTETAKVEDGAAYLTVPGYSVGAVTLRGGR